MHDEWTRLARYLAGECPPEEAEAARLWIEADPERQRMAAELRAAWDAATVRSDGEDEPTWDTPSAWQRLSARRRSRERRHQLGLVRAQLPLIRRSNSQRGWRLVSFAAAAAIFIAATAVLVQRNNRPSEITQTAALREIRTVPGQRAILTLTDGSRVVLGPASILRYDTAHFATTTRELQLTGQAHFTVAHIGGKAPAFLVRTEKGTIQDIGTAFNVRSIGGARGQLEVVVTDGSVLLAGRKLGRGDLATVDNAGGLQVRHDVSIERYTSWTEGRLVFDDTPLSEMIPELDRWYDLDITLADRSLSDRRFVGTLREGAASSALALLALSLDLQVTRAGRAVTLSPKPSDRSRRAAP